MGDAGWRRRRRRPRRPAYLGHLRPQVDLLQVDGVRPEVVEQLTEQDSIAEGLRQVEHLRRVPGHPVVGGQHLAVNEPLRALFPRLHARRLRDAARWVCSRRRGSSAPRRRQPRPTPSLRGCEGSRRRGGGSRAPREARLRSRPGPPPPGRSCSESARSPCARPAPRRRRRPLTRFRLARPAPGD